MANDKLITKLCIDGKDFKIALPDLEKRLDKLESTIEDNQQIYTYQHGLQTMAEAMQSVAEAAEQAMHGVCEAMARIYYLEDQLSASSASEKSENQEKILSGEFWNEIEKNNMFLQHLK